jgi:probable rRNA maturation factor
MGRRRQSAPIEVVDRFRPRTPAAFVRRVAAAARAHGRREELALAILLADDATIAALHGRYAGDPSPTDVMSFPGDGGLDVIVSVECARREARRRGHPIRSELALYVAHGVLHGCGFDDRTDAQRARMRAAERAVLASAGVRAIDDD